MKQAPRAVVGMPDCLPSPGYVKMRSWKWGSGRGRARVRLCVRLARRETLECEGC